MLLLIRIPILRSMGILQLLQEFDEKLFIIISSWGAVPQLDIVIVNLRSTEIWIPLYVYLLFWIVKYHRSFVLPFLVVSILIILLGDAGSSQLLKPLLERPRPCYNESLIPYLRNLIPCGGRYSLPSSHAVNHFGLATFWFWAASYLNHRKYYILFLWAFLVCYAQVYVGKHYPLDVLAGGFIGWCLGIAGGKLFEFWCARIVKWKSAALFDAGIEYRT